MREAQPGHFNQLGAGPATRLMSFARVLNGRLGLLDLIVAFAIASTVVLMINSRGGLSQLPEVKEGEVSPMTVRAPRTFDVEDKDAMENSRQEVQSRLPEIYDFDAGAVAGWGEKWKSVIRQMRLNRAQYRGSGDGPRTVATRLGISLSPAEFHVLEKLNFSPELERSINFALAPLWDRKIVQTRGFVSPEVELFDIKTSKTVPLKGRERDEVLTVDEAAAQVGSAARAVPRGRVGSIHVPWGKWSPAVRATVFGIQSRLVAPNVTLDRKEMESRRSTLEKGLHPIFQKLDKGEVIVREGERVTKHESQILQTLSHQEHAKSESENRPAQSFFGTLVIWLLLFFIRRQFPGVLDNAKDSLVAAIFLISSLAALKLSLIFQLNVLSESLSSVPEAFLVFLIPVAAPAMTLRLLLNAPMTILFSFLYALGACLIVGKAGLFGLYVLVSCLVGSTFLARCRTRSALYKAGVWTALVCGIGSSCLVAAWSGHIPFSGVALSGDIKESGDFFLPMSLLLVWTFVGGLLGGWFSSAFTLVMTPILENILDYTTDLKLLELARMDHPLLRDLVLKAPGTYHHSIIVGSLVEAGAEAIGANALLARVGSYYHDIGKIGRAEYFIENQSGAHNPHDNARPQLSAKIIISHVKEGRALAEEYKLGKSIIEFIETHHGTGLVSYFYNKAKQEAAQPDSSVKPDEISEDDFRYPGPKPRTREHAILALADSCEAATRSLVDPTPARLEGMVNKIVVKAYTEGLLDEADITLKEVSLVSKAFLRILLGIHHNRIQYPDQEKGLPPRPVTVLKASNR